MRKTMVLLMALLLGLVGFFAPPSKAPAQDDTSGTLKVGTKSIAVGVGVSWGDGASSTAVRSTRSPSTG